MVCAERVYHRKGVSCTVKLEMILILRDPRPYWSGFFAPLFQVAAVSDADNEPNTTAQDAELKQRSLAPYGLPTAPADFQTNLLINDVSLVGFSVALKLPLWVSFLVDKSVSGDHENLAKLLAYVRRWVKFTKSQTYTTTSAAFCHRGIRRTWHQRETSVAITSMFLLGWLQCLLHRSGWTACCDGIVEVEAQ